MIPKVTVFVATYNQEKYIKDCLDGIIQQQTDFPIQAHIFDDCSQDATPRIVMDYARRHPDLIVPHLLQENLMQKGVMKFTEVFLPHVESEYIAFCEGDDYWIDSRKLQQQVDFLDRHPDFSACVHNFIPKYEDVRPLEFQGHIKWDRILGVDDMILEKVTQTATLVIRRKALADNPEFLHSITTKEMQDVDLYIFLTLLDRGKVYGMADAMSVYRIHSKGVATSAVIDGSGKSDNEKLIRKLATCYNGKYRFINDLYDMRMLLDEWTYQRRSKNYLKALQKLFKAFACTPKGFLKLYYNRYVR